MALAEFTIPLTSVTVNSTLFCPISLHVKLYLLKVRVAIAQLSEDPLSTWAAVRFTFPLEFRFNIILLFTITIGPSVSGVVPKSYIKPFDLSKYLVMGAPTFPTISVTIKTNVNGPSFNEA